MNNELLLDRIASLNPEALTADGHDDSIIGITGSGTVVYDAKSIVDTLVKRDEMSEEDALEFFEYNIQGSHLGEYTPIYVWKVSRE